MLQNYQDAMVIVREFGPPEYMLTFTCNPYWPEIVQAMLPGQYYLNRPDILTRVFKLKLSELMEDVTKKHVLGE